MNMKSKQRNKTEARNSVSVAFTSEGWEDYCHWKDADSDVFATINTLIRECLRTPFKGTGKPEPLKYLGADVWSRRLTQEHRCVYLVKADRIEFLQGRYHY